MSVLDPAVARAVDHILPPPRPAAPQPWDDYDREDPAAIAAEIASERERAQEIEAWGDLGAWGGGVLGFVGVDVALRAARRRGG